MPSSVPSSEQEVALRQRQTSSPARRSAARRRRAPRRSAGRPRCSAGRRCGPCRFLRTVARAPHRRPAACAARALAPTPSSSAACETKVTQVACQRAAERAEHRPVVHRLRRRDRRVRIAHRRRGDHPALDDHRRLDAEERRLPQHQVGQLADLDRADLVRDAVGDGRVDRVLGDVALDAEVVVAAAGVLGQRRRAAASSCARSARSAMITSPTRPMACESRDIMLIAPRSCRMSSAAIVSRRMRDSAKATSSGIAGSRWWQTISMSRCSSRVLTVYGRVGLVDDGSTLRLAAHLDDVGRVPAAGALGVDRCGSSRPLMAAIVSSTKPDSLRVSVWIATWTSYCVGHAQAAVDRRRRGAPVLVQLQAHARRRAICSTSGLGQAGVALAEEAEVHRQRVGRLQHAGDVPGPGVQVVALVPAAGPVPPPIIVVTPDISASSICCGQMKWMWVSMPPAVSDHALAGDDLGARADDDGRRRAGCRGCRPCRCAAMRPSLMPMSALTMPQWSRISALVITVSATVGARRAGSGPCRRGSPCRRRTSPPRRRSCGPSRPR